MGGDLSSAMRFADRERTAQCSHGRGWSLAPCGISSWFVLAPLPFPRLCACFVGLVGLASFAERLLFFSVASFVSPFLCFDAVSSNSAPHFCIARACFLRFSTDTYSLLALKNRSERADSGNGHYHGCARRSLQRSFRSCDATPRVSSFGHEAA